MFKINPTEVPKLVASLFLGVIAGYILGWYFSPGQTSSPMVKPATCPVCQQNVTLPNVKNKLADIAISDSGNILVSTPRPGDTITTPLLINGLVRAFENRVQVRLKNKTGVEVRKTGFTAKKGEMGTYIALSVDLVFAQPTVPGDGTLEVFTNSAKDGSEIDKVTIPVKFSTKAGK